jgi:hypothetical protein
LRSVLALLVVLLLPSVAYGQVKVYRSNFQKSGSGVEPQTQDVTNIVDSGAAAFTPKVIIFSTGGVGTAVGFSEGYRYSIGVATCPALSTITNASVGGMSVDDNPTIDVASLQSNTASISIATAAGAAIAQGGVTACASGQFTITWTENTNTTLRLIDFIAIGGDDITDAEIVEWTATSADTGTKSITGFGFEPDVILSIIGRIGGSTASSGSGTVMGFGASLSDGTYAHCFGVSSDDDGPTTSDVVSVSDNGNVFCSVDGNTAAIDGRYALAAFTADGFDLGVTDAPSADTKVWTLGIKGGRHKVTTDTQPVAPGDASQTGLGIGTPVGLFAISGGSTGGVSTAARFSVGSSDGTRLGLAWMGELDNQGTTGSVSRSNILHMVNYVTPSSTAASSTVLAQVSAVAFGDSSYTLTWDDADATARQFVTWAIGSNAGAVVASPWSLGLLGVGRC